MPSFVPPHLIEVPLIDIKGVRLESKLLVQTDDEAPDVLPKLEPTCVEHSGTMVKTEDSSTFSTPFQLLAEGAGTSTLPLPLPTTCCSPLGGESESQSAGGQSDLVVPRSCRPIREVVAESLLPPVPEEVQTYLNVIVPERG